MSTMGHKAVLDGRKFTGNSGKHSVEVNVKIRKAGDQSSSRPQSPEIIRTPSPSPSLASVVQGNGLHRKGSWADLLSKGNKSVEVDGGRKHKKQSHSHSHKTQHEVVEMPKPKPKPILKGLPVGTQTDEQYQEFKIKDYTDTIAQLYQLCSKLREDLTESNVARAKMENELLAIIRDKDRLISSFTARTPPQSTLTPASTPSPLLKETEQLNKFRSLIGDVRNLLETEISEIRKCESPLPSPDLRLQKFLTLKDLDVVGGGDSRGTEDPTFLRDMSTSSVSSDKESVPDMDKSSTQYLNLPK